MKYDQGRDDETSQEMHARMIRNRDAYRRELAERRRQRVVANWFLLVGVVVAALVMLLR